MILKKTKAVPQGVALGAVVLSLLAIAARADAKVGRVDARTAEAQRHAEEANRLDLAGKYAEALRHAERNFQLAKKALGPKHPKLGLSLDHIGVLHMKQGNYAMAERLFLRALRLLEEAPREYLPQVIQVTCDQGLLYWHQGLYQRAETLLLRAIAMNEATLGKNAPGLALSLHFIALVYASQGFYERAEPLFQRARQIWEANSGRFVSDIASALNNLGLLYTAQGAYEHAREMYQRALEIREETLGKEHILVATALNNLGLLYMTQGLYAQAEPVYERALRIREATFEKNHPEIATSLHNLGLLRMAQGRYEDAKPLLERALEIRESVLVKNHPDVATSLHGLAELHQAQGAYEHAESLYRRALQIRETVLGKGHPNVAVSLHELARLYLAEGRLGDALPLLGRALTIAEARLRKESLDFSETRLAGLLGLLQRQDETFYEVLREHPAEAPVRQLALTAALLHKGRSLAEIADTSRVIYRSLAEADREPFLRLRALRTQRSELSFKGLGTLSPDAHRARLEKLEAQADALEADLARRSAPLRAGRQRPSSADIVAQVAAALPPDGALIEIVAFTARPLASPPGTPASQGQGTPVYAALILLPSGDIRAVELGTVEAIDSAVRRLRPTLTKGAEDDLTALQRLYDLVFRALVPLLGAQRQLFIAPDGQLNLVPWSALHDGARFVDDAYDVTYLTSGQDLLRRSENATPSGAVVVLADPDFGAAPLGRVARGGAAEGTLGLAVLSPERSAAVGRFFAQDRSALTNTPWDPLPGTREEALAIHRLLPEARLFLGAAATKQALLGVAAPDILHIATHGFFLGSTSVSATTRGRVSLGVPEASGVAAIPSDPLLRSGLVLAGVHAQEAPAEETAGGRAEAALVTALEIAGMDLWGTELVVLSACETGQGGVKPGQGVYGLRRAFTVAGAETLVTSLWRVDDHITRELMENYYRGLLAGEGRSRALREAMRKMRAQHPQPYYWSPFIVVGNGAPLRGVTSRYRSVR